MNNILSEKEYQHYIMERLSEDDGYVIRKAADFDSRFAMDREMLFQFLWSTQPETMGALRKIYKDKLEDTVVSFINAEATKARGSLLNILRHGIELSNMTLELMYTKPATAFNKELLAKYEKNVFSVMEEVWASDKERIDLVIFLNGLAIMSFELKCNAAGQSWQDAIYQYRTRRDPKTRLFLFKAGCLVNFAMDLEQVYMTTKLAGNATFFLPFNMGNGEGVNAGAGNPAFADRYSVSYMWEDILKKDTVLDLLGKFVFIDAKEDTDELTGKIKKSENIIFPRYHQLDVIRKLLADVRENRTAQNYLIQHSAGSGKTNSIAWLAHRLTSLHDAEDKIIFDNVVIVTDRVVVDRQLQKAILGLEHKAGLIRVMDDKCNSADLAIALNGNTKIIATTIQKFPYIVDSVKGLKNKRFAVIIDEAHSSTAGKDMAAVTQSLGAGEQEYGDAEDMITDEIRRNGKQANVSIFAFTATPKPTTIQLFGRLNTKGQREAFHVYSMKQAVEEGFILDVLQNYTTYQTFYQINKEIEEDPRCKTADAKRQIARFVELHETNISQRVEVIVEHFRTSVMPELGGRAKAMVITASRQGAVKYRQAFEDYTKKKGYTDIKALVAFSGKVALPDDDTEYTEASLNGFTEDRLTKEFDKDDYQVLLVANKYQTGFDQPKLCAMYVLKKLKGVSAVQTLSRLNRICPPFEKKTFVLDFVNSYEEITDAFAPYYTTTLLSNSVTPTAIYDLEAKIDAYTILDPEDVERTNDILYKEKIEETRLMLKACYRQYQQYSKLNTMLKNNLISMLDTAFPEVNRLFTSPPRTDGSEKWVDFVAVFWHCECVCGLSEKSFVSKYRKWCDKHGYNFSQTKALEIYSAACGHFSVMPKTDTAKLLVEQAVSQLRATSSALATLRQEMLDLASTLPEFPVVMDMFGVGPTLGPQLMAEIGDVRRFQSKKALVGFAGIDPPPNQSGKFNANSRSISKRGSPSLRRTLFLVMGVYLQRAPADEPVYQFMRRKRAEGKPYKVYMMASANKFLRVYYATVKAYLDKLEQA